MRIFFGTKFMLNIELKFAEIYGSTVTYVFRLWWLSVI